MSQESDSGQSRPAKPLRARPFSSEPHPFDELQTVINTERRGVAASADHPAGLQESSLLYRLFPPESSPAGQEPVQPTGLTLGHFVIENRIGMGGMGAVFRAVDQRLNRQVALKVLAPSQSRDPSAVERFHNEAQAAARLDHDNIARVYYIGEDQGLQFIAFEYITGINVRDLIQKQGQLHVAEAVSYALQIAIALNHTAAADVVHRDIKPSNIIISPNGRAKLVDWGLARKKSSKSAGELTAAGTTLGTFDYISPEQARDPRNVDVRSDIYSLGCTLYQMLTGEPPYPEGTMIQKLLDHQAKPLPDPATKNPSVSPELSSIVQKMMASEPRLRYASPDELIRDLMRVAGSLGLRGIHPDGLIWTSSNNLGARFLERNLGWMATAAALLLIVFLLERFPGLGQESMHQSRTAASERMVTPDRHRSVGNENVEGTEKNLITQSISRTPTGRGLDTGSASRFSDPSSIEDSATTTGSLGVNEPPEEAVAGTDGLLRKVPFGDPELKIVPEPGEHPVRLAQRAGRPGSDDSDGQHNVRRNAPAVAPRPNSVVIEFAEKSAPEISIVGESISYLTLEAACAAARDGNVIELRYNGPRSETQKPLRVSNKKITLRAAAGFRPLIEFEPKYVPGEGWETRLITVTRGRLDLIDLDIVTSVQQHVETDRWSLLALHGADEVRLQNVNVTIVNSHGDPATVVELKTGPGGDMQVMQDPNEAPPEFKIRIVDSFVRGGCDLFVTTHTRPGRFEVEKTAIAIEGSLLRVFGNRDMPPDGADIELELEHVTSLVGDSVVKMESGTESRELLTVRVSARDNIFVTTTGRPLVAMFGNTNIEDFRNRLRWDGAKNVYDHFDLFWSIASSQVLGDEEKYQFESWKQRWSDTEVDAHNEDIAWKRDWRNLVNRLVEITPADLELDVGVIANPTLFLASDATAVGANLTKLRSRDPLKVPTSTPN